MLVRRTNWPVLIAIAVLGPLLGAAVGAGYVPGPAGWLTDRHPTAPDQTDATPPDDNALPDRKVLLPDGDPVALDELAPERAVAIVVMKGPWCPVCQRQLKALSKMGSRLQAENAAVFGLTTAGTHRNEQLRQKLGLDFPILSDPSRKLHRELDLWLDERGYAMPGVIYLDESGEVADIHRGRYPGQPQEQCILQRLSQISGE
ncbi:MAG: redoxin domain-containing protein [Bradymonadaceae bacterium]